jgi:hypothetical protein
MPRPPDMLILGERYTKCGYPYPVPPSPREVTLEGRWDEGSWMNGHIRSGHKDGKVESRLCSWFCTP